jgi:hypothetical protein
VAEIQDGLGGRLHPRRGQDEPGGQPGGGPDECVSKIRPVAAVFAAVTDRMSIALMGTSRMASPRRSAWPMNSATTMVIPRLHQVKPTNADKPTASSTPATAAATRCTALRSFWYRLTWATRSAVSGASTGRGVTGSGSAAR